MRAIFDERQWQHDPKQFIVRGTIQPNPEQPERIRVLQSGAAAAGCDFVAPADAGMAPIAALHSPEYLTFLKTIHDRWTELDGSADEVIPNIHPGRHGASYPSNAIGQAGYHQADTACPIAAGTWEAAYWSAQTAIAGADLVAGGERAAYALARPPGHHAFGDMAGGFCFLNNSAIAAQRLLEAGRRPAILDVDVHHGNGTQGIFYHRSDVLTVSIHADPTQFYPFYWGHASERGEGQGLGYNLNLPLPLGAGDPEFLTILSTALDRIRHFGADTLVVALGLDAYENDPLKGLAVTTEGFGKIGAAIWALGLPAVLVQEGGYLCDELGHNLTSFLTGLEGT